MNSEELISRCNNKELIHKLKYCRTRARDCIAELKELVLINDRIKLELKMRITDLQLECEIAEAERLNCDDPLLDSLLAIN